MIKTLYGTGIGFTAEQGEVILNVQMQGSVRHNYAFIIPAESVHELQAELAETARKVGLDAN